MSNQLLSPSETANQELGRELTLRYKRAVTAWGAILHFGAMLAQIEAQLTANVAANSQPKGGRYVKGSGLKGFIETYAPEVDERKARRIRDIAQAVAEREKLDIALFTQPVEELPAKDRKKVEHALEWMDEKNMHAVQLELGLITTRGGDNARRDQNGKRLPAEQPKELVCPAWANEPEKALWNTLQTENQKLAFIDWRPRINLMASQVMNPRQGWLADMDDQTKGDLVATCVDLLAFLAPATLKNAPKA